MRKSPDNNKRSTLTARLKGAFLKPEAQVTRRSRATDGLSEPGKTVESGRSGILASLRSLVLKPEAKVARRSRATDGLSEPDRIAPKPSSRATVTGSNPYDRTGLDVDTAYLDFEVPEGNERFLYKPQGSDPNEELIPLELDDLFHLTRPEHSLVREMDRYCPGFASISLPPGILHPGSSGGFKILHKSQKKLPQLSQTPCVQILFDKVDGRTCTEGIFVQPMKEAVYKTKETRAARKGWHGIGSRAAITEDVYIGDKSIKFDSLFSDDTGTKEDAFEMFYMAHGNMDYRDETRRPGQTLYVKLIIPKSVALKLKEFTDKGRFSFFRVLAAANLITALSSNERRANIDLMDEKDILDLISPLLPPYDKWDDEGKEQFVMFGN